MVINYNGVGLIQRVVRVYIILYDFKFSSGSLFVCSGNKNFVCKLFVCSSSLNGCNGEWTNTDDLDFHVGSVTGPRGNVKQALVMPRRNNLGVNGRCDPPVGGYVPLKLPQDNKVNAEIRVHDLQPPEKVVGDIYYHIRCESKYYTDGVRLYTKRIFDKSIEPGMMLCSEHGPGWCKVSKDVKLNKLHVVVPLFTTYDLPAFYCDGVSFDAQQYFLLTLAVDVIKQTVRPNIDAQSTYTMITAKAVGVYLNVPQECVEQLVTFFTHDIRCRINMKDRLFINASLRTKDKYVVQPDPGNITISTSLHNPFRRDSIRCALDPVYIRRPDVSFVLHGHAYMLGSQKTGCPMFREENNVTPNMYHTVMFSLEGPRKFVAYDVSGYNACIALRRIAAVRDGPACNYDAELKTFLPDCNYDARLKTLQNRLGYDLRKHWKKDDLDRVCWPTKSYDIEVSETQHTLACRDFMVKHLLIMIDRCDPTYVQWMVDTYIGTSNWLYYKIFEAKLTYIEPIYSRNACGDLVHVKRKLRQCFVRNWNDHSTSHVMGASLKAHVKRELAKPGSVEKPKAPRLFVSYDDGCMYANELPEYLKVCMCEPYVVQINGSIYIIRIFSKPRMCEICNEFESAISAQGVPGVHYIFIYSDDSVYMGTTLSSQRYAKNVDVSSCDSNNGPTPFRIIGEMMSRFDHERAIGQLLQCRKDICLVNPSDKTSSIIVSVDGPFFGSGVTITTGGNCMTSFTNALGFIASMECPSFWSDQPIEDHIIFGAEMAGHKVTIEDCGDVYEKIQFLKLSPMMTTDNKWVMCRNLGAMCKGLGKIEGDMTQQQLGLSKEAFRDMPWDQRMDLFTSSVIASYQHEPSNILLDALRSRFNVPTTLKVESSVLERPVNSYTVTIESVCRRYDVTAHELLSLASSLGKLELGDVIVDTALEAIYRLDYGL